MPKHAPLFEFMKCPCSHYRRTKEEHDVTNRELARGGQCSSTQHETEVGERNSRLFFPRLIYEQPLESHTYAIALPDDAMRDDLS